MDEWVLKRFDNVAEYYFIPLRGHVFLYKNFIVFVSSMYSLHVASVLKTILVLGLKWLLVAIHTVSHAGKVCLVFYSPLLLLTQIKFWH
jgi:hypothetical protein